jgi:hypothetical protein
MGGTNDLARQRLTHFLAARLEARKREASGALPASAAATIRSRLDEKFLQSGRGADLGSRATTQSEAKHDPITRLESSN